MKSNISFLFANLFRFVRGKSPKSLFALKELFSSMEEARLVLARAETCTDKMAIRMVLADFKRSWLLIDNSALLYPLLADCSRLHCEMHRFHSSLDPEVLESLRDLMRLYIMDANVMHSKLVA
ncbi:MAG: hypothetical protein VX278_04665 [Myxococcota bacterium]|nr:hypothetical protein [Myxococcota bacterium]